MATSGQDETRDGQAFGILLSDLVERLLALSDNPRQACDYIAEELRSLVGARTVVVVSHVETKTAPRHRIRSVYPERRKAVAENPAFHDMIERSHLATCATLLATTDQGSDSELLERLGVETALILPLAYGSKRVGSIFLFDLLDDVTLQKAMDTLVRLSSILALVLRNADLYEHLEAQVAERTAMLERRKLELEALLREVHHRVKNNLQIVLSLLYLKSSSTSSEEAKSILQESQDSIFAMSQVHEEIYRTGDFSGIDMADYLPRVIDQMIAASNIMIATQYHLEGLRLDLGIAIPCGLIVSELVTNSIKYAFSSREKGVLTVESGLRNGEAYIRIADDGPGFPASPEAGRKGGVGMDIVQSLVEQIGGHMVRDPGPGASVTVIFKPR